MARVTVEDCIEKISNRFDLVLAAAQRARSIQKGELLTIDRDNDKNPVVALREIAAETVEPEILRDNIVKNMQRLNKNEERLIEDEAGETARLDLDEMVNAGSDEAFIDAGMQVGSFDDAPATETTGFEDVDVVTLEDDN